MAFDNSEISGLSLSKGSLYEEMTMTQAALDDSRLQVQVSLSNEQIHKDDKILNTYTVLDDAISGGMGSVWRVHHESWNTDLAMKRPQPRFFAEGGDARKAEFISECENWINLGLHPNIVSCYYVREIGGIPSIFSEWMDNGNLKERIRDGSLYEGTEDEVQARILDIAIQTARGLAYSHENGLIHQDIKPGNILLSKSWEAKITDFGLAKARSQLTEGGKAMSSGYTLEYCPKEQAEGSVPEPWMDIYAWALTVLEMFAGKRLWSTGADALAGIEDSVPASEASHSRFQTWLKKTFGDKSQVRETPPYSALKQNFSLCRISVPEKLQTFLVSCLEHKHENGMSDFTSIEQFLIEFYKESQGEVYVRPEPHAAPDTYFSLNNRAISMIDLGKSDEAYTLLKDTVSSNSTDFICQYNLALLEWKSKRISYQEFRDRVISARDGSELSESLSEKVLSVAGRDYSNEELKNKELLRWSREDEYVDPNRKVKADDASGPLRIWEAETGICLGFHHFVPDAGWFEGGRIIGVYQPDGPIVYMVNGYESPEYIPLPVPGICFPFAPERIQTSHEINGELERLKKSYFQALEAYECGNYEDVRRILAPYCASNIIVQHEEAALLWSKLHQYYEAEQLIAVVPTREDPSPAPSAFRAVYGNLSSGKNKADNGIVLVKAKLMLMQEHEGNTGDLYCDLEWSLTGYDSRNNTKEVFHIPYFAYETQFDEDEWDTSLYLSFDEEGKLHWSSYKQGVVDLRDAEYQKNTRGAFTMSGDYGMTFYLPGGSTLQNTQEGLKIGNILLDDEFTGCYPLWNADILQCRKNNYLLLFTYGEKQKEQ